MPDLVASRSRLYRDYTSTHHWESLSGEVRPNLLRQVFPLVPQSRATRVVEVGCGSGSLLKLFREFGYRRVEGVDVSPDQVELAKKAGLTNVHLADIREYLQRRPGHYDVVVALDVLEHFQTAELLEVLDAVRLALRPGGVLVLRSPNASSPFFGRYRYGDLTHGLAFTTRSLRQGLLTCGFTSVEFYPVEPVVHGVVSFVRLMIWRFCSALFKMALIAETGETRGHIVTQNLMARAQTGE